MSDEFINPWKADRKASQRHYSLLDRNPLAQRVYDSSQWKAIRARRKNENPLCQHCEANGLVRAGQEVDHIKCIRDYPELAFDYANTQTLCKKCHRIKTAKENASD